MTAHHDTALLPFCRAHVFQMALFVLTLLTPLAVARAQSGGDSLLRVGARVRVATVSSDNAIGSRQGTGVVQALAADSLTVAWDNGLRSTLAHAAISHIDVSLGRKPYVLRGMGIGLLSGAVIGGVIGAIAYEPSEFLDFGMGFEMAAYAVIGGGAGTLIGGVVGASGKRDAWSRAQLRGSSQRVSAAPYFGARAQGVKVLVSF